MRKYLVSFQKYIERRKFKTALDIFQIMKIKDIQNNKSQGLEILYNKLIINQNCMMLEIACNKLLMSKKKIKDHDFNKKDYSSVQYQESLQVLINSIKHDRSIVEFLQFLVHLTSIDNSLIQCGSNSLNLKYFLMGANLVQCNLCGSEFDDVNIDGINLNGALLLNCKWSNLRIQELNQFIGHTRSVNSACFSPDGKILASSSHENSILQWDIISGQQKAILNGHTNSAMSVCFQSNGNILTSGSEDKSILLWDIQTKQQIAKLDGHTHFFMSVCFSPDGNTSASGSHDRSIRLWDITTGLLKAKLDGHQYAVMSVCYSPDGNNSDSGLFDEFIRFQDVKTENFISFFLVDVLFSSAHYHFIMFLQDNFQILRKCFPKFCSLLL
ncbi:unnamed protein product [Paramecium pentaurelia]|uniref:WD-40 repeat protein n=1 Tax=Paramecium pentaurelia TaxID=43138 RepID=A0A8S1YJ73_9CILI|nr:unnamed protein product [Paramecium pentaurelia]